MKIESEIKVLRHLSEELDMLSESRDLEVASAAMKIRPGIDEQLLDARRRLAEEAPKNGGGGRNGLRDLVTAPAA